MTAHRPPIGRRVLKSAWRIAATPALRNITDIDELMQHSRRIANLCYLDARQHRRACELAVELGEEKLARWLTDLEIHGPFDND